MAGAGQPFYMPLTWPLGHLHYAFSAPKDEKVQQPTASADLNLIGHLTSVVAATRSFLMALLCIYVLTDDYPAFGTVSTVAIIPLSQVASQQPKKNACILLFQGCLQI